MDRRAFVRYLASGLFAFPLATHALLAGRSYRIGWLREGVLPIGQSFWDAMGEFGWIEGKNDLILTDGTPATRAAKVATQTIPIVFSIGADPVDQRFVSSLAKPGGNLTGFTFGSYEDKQLQVLKQAMPGISRVAYPVREANPAVVRAAATLDLEVEAIRVRGPDDLAVFFQAVRSRRVDAVVFTNIAWMGPHEKRIAAEAIKFGMPLIGTWRNFAVSGALLSYGPKPNYWPRVAAQVDKLFRGAKSADLPVELPTTFELVVNLKTAKLLGITISQAFLLRANEVIE